MKKTLLFLFAVALAFGYLCSRNGLDYEIHNR